MNSNAAKLPEVHKAGNSSSTSYKKVYADYHGLRYSRPMDGELGQWKLSGTALGSKVEHRYANWNADLIDDEGRHQTSAQAYPVVGMQSQNDPDYAEYQILLAKAAGIDGFMVEWGFPGHQSDHELKLLLEVARKHQFEIGITWCDAWHFYDWIEQLHPEIRTRQDKVEQFKRSLQYLLDNVYASEAGAVYDGHPLIFLFGGGPTAEEFEEIKAAHYRMPEGMKEPWFIGRAPIVGRVESGKSDAVSSTQYDETAETVIYEFEDNGWYRERPNTGQALLDGCFGWIPTRVRRGSGSLYPHWDRYATKDDAVTYLQQLHTANNERAYPFKLRISSVNPEMDNRGCASWGKHDLSHIPREQGEVYEMMWQFNCENRDTIDIVFAVTWNDFTEMTQIEPTIEDGDREIVTTCQYAALFKGTKLDTSGLTLPFQLFQLRKELDFCRSVGHLDDTVTGMLDMAAAHISSGKYTLAVEWLQRAQQRLHNVRIRTVCDNITLTVPSNEIRLIRGMDSNSRKDERGLSYHIADGLAFAIEEHIVNRLHKDYFEGFVHFEYWDDGDESFTLLSDTDRSPAIFGDYSVICDIKKDNTRNWVKAKVKLYKINCALSRGLPGETDFAFRGHGQVRNIRFEFTTYRLLNEDVNPRERI